MAIQICTIAETEAFIKITCQALQHEITAGVGEPPTDWPTDLLHPEALSPANAKEADDVSELVGNYVAAALYSKTWQLREAGLNHLQACLSKLVSSSGDSQIRIIFVCSYI